jgi:probable HAF family extracellular repeat protein
VPPAVLHFEPVIWRNGKVQELPTFPGDPDGGGSAINDPGQVLVFTGSCTFTSGHDSLLQHGTLTPFGTLGGFPLAAKNVNNKGLVVGTLVGPGESDMEAFIWQNGVATGLGTLPGDTGSVANASNDKGQVTGQSCDANGNCRGFLWQDGVMTGLSSLVPADSTLNFFDPTDIDSRGEIVGLGIQKSTGELRGFLLTSSNGGAAGEGTAAAAPDNVSPRTKVVLPENIRRALIQQRLGHRYHIPGLSAQLQK